MCSIFKDELFLTLHLGCMKVKFCCTLKKTFTERKHFHVYTNQNKITGEIKTLLFCDIVTSINKLEHILVPVLDHEFSTMQICKNDY